MNRRIMCPKSKKIYFGLNYLGEKTETFAKKWKNYAKQVYLVLLKFKFILRKKKVTLF